MKRLFKNYWISVREEWKKTYLHLFIRKLYLRVKLWLIKWWTDLMQLVGDVRRQIAVYKAEEYHARTGKKVNVVDGRFNTAIITRQSRKELKKHGILKSATTGTKVDQASHLIIQKGKKYRNNENQMKKRRK